MLWRVGFHTPRRSLAALLALTAMFALALPAAQARRRHRGVVIHVHRAQRGNLTLVRLTLRIRGRRHKLGRHVRLKVRLRRPHPRSLHLLSRVVVAPGPRRRARIVTLIIVVFNRSAVQAGASALDPTGRSLRARASLAETDKLRISSPGRITLLSSQQYPDLLGGAAPSPADCQVMLGQLGGAPALLGAVVRIACGQGTPTDQSLLHRSLGAQTSSAPGPTGGGLSTFGSDLSHPANVSAHSPVDSDYWRGRVISSARSAPLSAPLGPRQVTSQSPFAPLAVPVTGQILTVRLKGTALASGRPQDPGPLTAIHFSVLHPQPDGSVLVRLTSQAYAVPVGGDSQQVSVYHPEHLCAGQGDLLALSTEGGFDPTYYPQGVSFEVFSDTDPTQAYYSYSRHGGVMNGDRFAGNPTAGTELLMQADLGIGSQASALCPGGTNSHS